VEDVKNEVEEVEEVEMLSSFGDDAKADNPYPVSNSLAGRMASRSEELAKNTTEVFPLPGWEDILGVELRVLSYTTIRKIGQRNNKVRDEVTSELYNLTDQIAAATEGFVEIEGEKQTPIDETWVSLANKLPDAPDSLTLRQAVLFVVGDKRIHFLAADWMEWARTSSHDVDKEVGSDFGTTG